MFEHLFHLARPEGSYTYYGEEHHLPALYYLDFAFVGLLLAAATSAAMLVILLPAVRERINTLLMGLSIISTGTAIGYCLIIPEWQVGRMKLSNVAMSYWPGAVRQDCVLGLGIGLTGANVTLICNASPELYYNEHLGFEQQVSALRRGMLPPLLTALTPLAGPSGFLARRAGHWTICTMYGAATMWLYACVLLAAAPHLAGDALLAMGSQMQLGVLLYHALQGPGSAAPRGLVLHYGPCFWVCLGVGVMASMSGVYLGVMARRRTDHCLTAFQVEIYQHCCEEQRSAILDESITKLTAHQQGVSHTEV